MYYFGRIDSNGYSHMSFLERMDKGMLCVFQDKQGSLWYIAIIPLLGTTLSTLYVTHHKTQQRGKTCGGVFFCIKILNKEK